MSIQDLRRLRIRNEEKALGRVTDCLIDPEDWSIVALTVRPAPDEDTDTLRLDVRGVEMVESEGEDRALLTVAGARPRMTAADAADDGAVKADEIEGRAAMATDGEIGPVEGLVVETGPWHVDYLVLDTRDWLPGRKVMVRPNHVRRFEDGRLHLDLTRESILSAVQA